MVEFVVAIRKSYSLRKLRDNATVITQKRRISGEIIISYILSIYFVKLICSLIKDNYGRKFLQFLSARLVNGINCDMLASSSEGRSIKRASQIGPFLLPRSLVQSHALTCRRIKDGPVSPFSSAANSVGPRVVGSAGASSRISHVR